MHQGSLAFSQYGELLNPVGFLNLYVLCSYFQVLIVDGTGALPLFCFNLIFLVLKASF